MCVCSATVLYSMYVHMNVCPHECISMNVLCTYICVHIYNIYLKRYNYISIHDKKKKVSFLQFYSRTRITILYTTGIL
jgi:hypothetical protein